MATPSIKLHAFHLQPRTQPIRFALAVGDIPYEEISYTQEEFAEKKA